ncbi:hypothetical protein [Fontivita pretiosa]|jgi:hypothetical protein|uniref:hypothetical protein n=1 Tax=Fontivita pretiosa TaxID=2989684 RepID=UPI003D17836A
MLESILARAKVTFLTLLFCAPVAAGVWYQRVAEAEQASATNVLPPPPWLPALSEVLADADEPPADASAQVPVVP